MFVEQYFIVRRKPLSIKLTKELVEMYTGYSLIKFKVEKVCDFSTGDYRTVIQGLTNKNDIPAEFQYELDYWDIHSLLLHLKNNLDNFYEQRIDRTSNK